MGQGTGQGCHNFGVADVVDHPVQGHLLGVENGVAVFGKEVIQGIKAGFKSLALLKLASAEIDFFRRFPVGIRQHISCHRVKDGQQLRGV